MNKAFKDLADKLVAGESADDVLPSEVLPRERQPVLWLLGKTGAGKTSLIRCLTGLSSAEIGNGFEPCTRTAQEFEFPNDAPLIRFLDTRGLDESAYDPVQDLRECRDRSHAVLVVARLDDPVQKSIAETLRSIKKSSPQTPFIVIHNAADTISDDKQRERSRYANQKQFEDAVGQTISFVETAMPREDIGPQALGISALLEALLEVIPEAALLLLREERRDKEAQAFQNLRSQVLRYAYAAGSADLAPAIGAVAVPAIQAGLLGAIGKAFGVSWTRRRVSEFSIALGAGVMLRFGGSYLSRQLAKLLPVYGQTVGAVAAGTISFATSYALGRSAAYYLYQVQQGKPLNQQEVRAIYKNALRQAMKTKHLTHKAE